MPAQAAASVGSSLKIRWVGERPKAAEVGKEFVGQVEVIAPHPGVLEKLEVVGAGWSPRGTDTPGAVAMRKGEPRVVTFRAIPNDPSQPLTLRATFDGVATERSLKLDAASLKGRRLRYVNGAPKLSGQRPQRAPGTTQRTETPILSFQGDFRYTRGDGVVLGADHIRVKIWDDDSPDPFDDLIWSGETDANGHFQVTLPWDDCDITGCDDPDIYIEIIATGDACDLQEDNLTEDTYKWESPVIDNFTGTFIDFGVMTPGDVVENAAVHIFNSVTRAYRFARNRAAMNAPMLDVQFPDGGTTTRYDQGFQEMHVVPDDMWNEVTHTHEFGHHLNNVFGNFLDPDYDNGFCDTPNPGHCYWCPEHVGEGWQEGFADWYGMLVVEAYASDYGQTPWIEGHPELGIYKDDNVNTCNQDNINYPDSRTEGYVAALLRDMQDGANDNHVVDPAPDCAKDAMSIGYDEILTVFRDDDPTDMGMFLNSFRARYPQFDMDLYSTTLNAGPTFGFPLPDPVVVSQPPSCLLVRAGETTTLNVDGNGSLLTYQWRRNGVNLTNGSGKSGVATKTLTLSPMTPSLGGDYDCVVTTCDGTKTVTSAGSHISVLDAIPTPRPYVAWGENQNAQIGNGTVNSPLPQGQYTGLTNLIQVEGGRTFTMALKSDGTVYTWGKVEGGELGDGHTFSDVYFPQQISLSNVIQIAAGNVFGLALRRDGSIVGWGYNFWGTLGDGTQNSHNVPYPTNFPGCFVAIAGGFYHTIALRSDGTVWSCGYGDLGSLGFPTTNTVNPNPTQVPGLSNVIAIDAAYYSSYALKSDGTVWAWGFNVSGNLGDGTLTQRNSPVQVVGLTNVRAIAAAEYNGYAIRSNGEVYAWGRGDLGGIGNGSAADRYVPVLVPGISNPKKIIAGDAGWAMALMQDGTLQAWGANTLGVLGTGAPLGSSQYSPAPVLNAAAVNDLGAGTATAHVLGHLMGITGVETDPVAPVALALRVSPMPARSSAMLAFDLPTAGRVSISVFDVSGRLVAPLVSETKSAGRHVVTWDGRSRSGERVSAGVYFARLERAGKVLTKRIVFVR